MSCGGGAVRFCHRIVSGGGSPPPGTRGDCVIGPRIGTRARHIYAQAVHVASRIAAHGIPADGNIFLSNAQKAANSNHDRYNLTILVDDHVVDGADVLVIAGAHFAANNLASVQAIRGSRGQIAAAARLLIGGAAAGGRSGSRLR